jgi:hypothetical protein
MALLWIEGFEGYGTTTGTDVTTYMARRYQAYNGVLYIGAGRLSGYAGYGASGTTYYLTTPAMTTSNTLVIGFGLKRVGSSTTSSVIQLYDSTTLGIDVKWNYNTRELDVYRNTTFLGSTSGANILAGSWYYVEIKVKCDASAGTVEVRVGGVTKLSLTNQNTKNGTHTYHNVVRLYANSYVWLDDLYILDVTGAANNDFLGNRRVIGIFPSGDASVAWTPSSATTHATLVDETLDNDDTDYVESSTSGQADLYEYGDASGIGAISGIQINTTCRETDTNHFNLVTRVVSNGTTSDDAGQLVGTTGWVNRSRILETDPATGSAWILAALNAAQIGVKVG